jgi:cysteine-rich repeat protein
MHLWPTLLSLVATLLILACTSDEQAGFGQTASTSTEAPTTDPTTPTDPTEPDPSPDSSTGTTEVDAVSTSTPSDTSTGEASGCGDGVVGPDEQCDDGLAFNTASAACLPNCVLNICGDGFVEAGV